MLGPQAASRRRHAAACGRAGSELRSYELEARAREAELCRESQHCDVEKAKEMSGNENADEKNVCRLLLPPRSRCLAMHHQALSLSLSLLLDLTDTRACCCCCSNQLGIIIPWGLHEVLGGLRQHLLVVHTSFPPTYSLYTVIEIFHFAVNGFPATLWIILQTQVIFLEIHNFFQKRVP